jgi:ADP-ribose pyrophosphatase YjhB (NUDIX family)
MKVGIDYTGVGMGAFIINDDGKFLLTKRGQKAKNERGKWEIAGGALKFGETFAEGLRIEM